MKMRSLVLFISFFVLVACQADEGLDSASTRAESEFPAPSSDGVPVIIEGTVTRDNLLTCAGYLAQHNGEEFCVTLYPQDGTARKGGDFLSCDGYLVRFKNEEYCASTVPDDWVPFEFNGYTYYRQPLLTTDE